MSKLRKMTAVLLSLLILVCCFAVNAGAAGVPDNAKTITSGKTYEETTGLIGSTVFNYKIKVTKAGTMTIKLNAKTKRSNLWFMNSNGKSLEPSGIKSSKGSAEWGGMFLAYTDVHGDGTYTYSGNISYTVSKGTYYIKYQALSPLEGSFSISCTTPKTSSTSSTSTGKLTGIALPMKVGETVQLAAATTGKVSGKVKWSSSDKKIATVSSSGKVTAKKKGTAAITCKLGKKKSTIYVNVT